MVVGVDGWLLMMWVCLVVVGVAAVVRRGSRWVDGGASDVMRSCVQAPFHRCYRWGGGREGNVGGLGIVRVAVGVWPGAVFPLWRVCP